MVKVLMIDSDVQYHFLVQVHEWQLEQKEMIEAMVEQIMEVTFAFMNMMVQVGIN